MTGERIESLKTALQIFLRGLPQNCRFNIIAFESHAHPLFPEGCQSYNSQTFAKATEFVDALTSMGGMVSLR
jgi:hypothetical protein